MEFQSYMKLLASLFQTEQDEELNEISKLVALETCLVMSEDLEYIKSEKPHAQILLPATRLKCRFPPGRFEKYRFQELVPMFQKFVETGFDIKTTISATRGGNRFPHEERTFNLFSLAIRSRLTEMLICFILAKKIHPDETFKMKIADISYLYDGKTQTMKTLAIASENRCYLWSDREDNITLRDFSSIEELQDIGQGKAAINPYENITDQMKTLIQARNFAQPIIRRILSL